MYGGLESVRLLGSNSSRPLPHHSGAEVHLEYLESFLWCIDLPSVLLMTTENLRLWGMVGSFGS